MRKVETLIKAAAERAGNQNKLAAALGVSRGNVTDWAHGRTHVPDKHVLTMARIAGWRPVETALEVYKERLGELAKTLAIGAVTIIGISGLLAGAAQPAHAHSTSDNV
jgi:DNA-binding transcriptional regulator YdaS (Cro superfamily)